MAEGPVAVVGLGRMGAAMADTLSRSGFDLVLWNRTRSVADELAAALGAQVASTPAEAASHAEIVVSSLADDAALRAVHIGAEGTLAGATNRSVIVDTSTVDPMTVREVALRFTEIGALFLDAPVSGSVGLVQQGGLTSMVGGPEEALERVRPVLDSLSKAVFHLGPSGAGATMKLAVNALVHATNQALAESLVLAEAAGVDRSLAYDVFSASAASSPFIQYKRPAYESPSDAPVAFSLDLVAKDLELILGLAGRVSAPMAQGEANAAVVRAAIAAGLGSADMSALAVHLRGTDE